jgi:hypothetical protein
VSTARGRAKAKEEPKARPEHHTASPPLGRITQQAPHLSIYGHGGVDLHYATPSLGAQTHIVHVACHNRAMRTLHPTLLPKQSPPTPTHPPPAHSPLSLRAGDAVGFKRKAGDAPGAKARMQKMFQAAAMRAKPVAAKPAVDDKASEALLHDILGNLDTGMCVGVGGRPSETAAAHRDRRPG